MSDSEWSDKFSLDTVGSSGTVTCKFKGHTLEVSSCFQCVPSRVSSLCRINCKLALCTLKGELTFATER